MEGVVDGGSKPARAQRRDRAVGLERRRPPRRSAVERLHQRRRLGEPPLVRSQRHDGESILVVKKDLWNPRLGRTPEIAVQVLPPSAVRCIGVRVVGSDRYTISLLTGMNTAPLVWKTVQIRSKCLPPSVLRSQLSVMPPKQRTQIVSCAIG